MMSGRKVQKVMVQPINLIFRYLQNRTRIQIWLYEDVTHRIEGYIVGFDEYMNVVLDEAEELNVKTQSRNKLGRILLKGDNITMIHAVTKRFCLPHLLKGMLLVVALLFLPHIVLGILNTGVQLRIEELFDTPGHTNNWAVLVCTSRFWFNYRHVSNVLALYHTVKRLGIPESNIILMLAEDIPCNPRNPRPGTVYAARAGNNLYGIDVEVDYRGEEVTVENFIRLLTGRHHPATPRSKRLLTDHQSNVLIYLTGHGGDSFLKFQDAEELTNVDLAYAIQTMYEDNRYHEMFLIADTCRSASMYEWVSSPGVLSTSSSLTHEESYSYDVDDEIGVYVIDRYTHFTVAFLNREVKSLNSTATMQDYLESCSRRQCLSTVGVRKDTYPKEPSRVRVTDFFGSSRIIRHLSEEIEIDDEWLNISN
ncbi:unnamed protein product [Haemonchus placei]|uniref:Probable small nuclear ribonucleoprotein E n=1 Tax=Haemonchus placei TaxID=6290 RepID=A0A0N4WAH7_HAEPC|nr:unnamed protein product [Haemonchus placei]